MPRGLPSKARSAAIGMRVRPGWNRIAREVLAARQFDGWENARLFALLNLAMADGYIADFENKYHCDYWRPVTAIRAGGDSEWLKYFRPARTGLPLKPYGGGGCCGYGDGPVLQHRLHEFLDDQRCPLSGHHPKVLELLGSSARKWCVSYPLRNPLFDGGERRLYPGRTHWGMGFRKRIATCKAPTSDHRFRRVEKDGTVKLPSIRNIGEALSGRR